MANKMNSSAILASLSPQEILDFQVHNGMLDPDNVREQIVDKSENGLKLSLNFRIKSSIPTRYTYRGSPLIIYM
jgi:hypothetical protein